ncbi:MAG: nucleotidyl transferase AbiEii/AbiGii toxin family protein, partial [Candidatus Methanomethylophilaceae archaeon]|nr:nucleotidyl transferase AbiEii/AbiGii toxin family protein [Candidatus Methanomethylophilaceae archaeon]
MNENFNDILAKYDTSRPKDRENAIREIIQEGVLYSLSQTDFFDRAAFMGGTDLRILHGLNRFSEDLDFMLKTPDPDFELETYLPTLKDGLRHFGIDFDVSLSEKTKRTTIKEGVVKAHTKELYLKFYSDSEYHEDVYPTQLTRVKIEVDTDPAENAGFENRFKTSPFGYKVTSCDLPTMFSGKIHAILCRPWANRFKGRDLYDFIFYIDKGVRYNRGF